MELQLRNAKKSEQRLRKCLNSVLATLTTAQTGEQDVEELCWYVTQFEALAGNINTIIEDLRENMNLLWAELEKVNDVEDKVWLLRSYIYDVQLWLMNFQTVTSMPSHVGNAQEKLMYLHGHAKRVRFILANMRVGMWRLERIEKDEYRMEQVALECLRHEQLSKHQERSQCMDSPERMVQQGLQKLKKGHDKKLEKKSLLASMKTPIFHSFLSRGSA